jgi:hypothetical protein
MATASFWISAFVVIGGRSRHHPPATLELFTRIRGCSKPGFSPAEYLRLGRDLSAHFPLDPRRPVSVQVPGYNKNMSVDLARLTTLAHLAGTDLRDFLVRVARLVDD